MSVFSDFSSFYDDDFSDGDFSDCSEIMPVVVHRSTKKTEASKKYNTSEELMFINCARSISYLISVFQKILISIKFGRK